MKIERFGQRVLTADEGCYLTDGDTVATTVFLGKDADLDEWREITAAQKEEWEATHGQQDLTEGQ